jgi:hypothetical protein
MDREIEPQRHKGHKEDKFFVSLWSFNFLRDVFEPATSIDDRTERRIAMKVKSSVKAGSDVRSYVSGNFFVEIKN